MMLPKKILQKCPICGFEYDYNKIRILETEDFYILSYLKCSNCLAGVILKIFILPHGLVGQAVVTDLDADEILNLKKINKPVDSSDVLLMYGFFKSKSDLSKVLKD